MIPEVHLPESRTMITLEVRRREFLTPGFASITLKGPALRDLVLADNDQAVRLFFPRGAQTALRMPTISTGLGTQTLGGWPSRLCGAGCRWIGRASAHRPRARPHAGSPSVRLPGGLLSRANSATGQAG
ncbi:siderophore-interacting protein [Streptomyces malaysiensis]|uniref:siderophore-interacting protein n=1 Tax=Streptomyces malaysiensis TaxID=92644 RepID=UPI003402CF53